MIPVMKWYERLLAWLLMRIESRHGWGGGFGDDGEGMRWMLQADHACCSRCIGLMRDYMYVLQARQHEKGAEQ